MIIIELWAHREGGELQTLDIPIDVNEINLDDRKEVQQIIISLIKESEKERRPLLTGDVVRIKKRRFCLTKEQQYLELGQLMR